MKEAEGTSVRRGVMAGGNWIVDFVKMIDTYPGECALANIYSQSSSFGGAPYNVLKALCRMEVGFPLEGIGVVGEDSYGTTVRDECRRLGIGTDGLRVQEKIHTGYTDVMTVRGSGKRTFFHSRGANALLREQDFDFAHNHKKIFHLGYLLLLDGLDETGPDAKTGAARVLERAKTAGLITSADVVSEESDRFGKVIPPALPYLDILFVNELEAARLSGMETVKGGRVSVKGCEAAARQILCMGMNGWVIVHFPEGALAVHTKEGTCYHGGVRVPREKILGTVGAGDAFAAGVLAGLHEGYEIGRCLLSGVSVAASSLAAGGATEGIRPWQECLDEAAKFGYYAQPED